MAGLTGILRVQAPGRQCEKQAGYEQTVHHFHVLDVSISDSDYV
jgi:hypothetical protein